MKEKILLLIKDPKKRNPFLKNENHRKEFFKYFTVQNLNLAADSLKYLNDDSDVKELFNFKNKEKLISLFVIKVIKPEK